MVSQKESKLIKKIDKEIGKFIPKINCEICGKEEKRLSSRHRFCKGCKIKVIKMKKKKYNQQPYLKSLYEEGNKLIGKIKCLECKKERYDYKVKGRKFCWTKCQDKWKSKHFVPKNKGKNSIIIKCKTCKKKVKSFTWATTKFCSRKCYEIDHKENWTFPHKGKPILEWIFKGDLLKLEIHRRKLREGMIKFYKKNPKFLQNRTGKSLIEIYGEEKAKEIQQKIKENILILWQIPSNRKKWLQTNGRFQKKDIPWNKGIPQKQITIKKQQITREKNYLKKIGIIQ